MQTGHMQINFEIDALNKCKIQMDTWLNGNRQFKS